MKKSLPSIGWVLLGILALAATVISLGKRENVANPSSNNYGPSGLVAFAALLKESGYDVVSTNSVLPQPAQGDLVIACLNQDSPFDFHHQNSSLFGKLDEFVKAGGKMMVLPIDADFSGGTRQVQESDATSSAEENRHLKVDLRGQSPSFDPSSWLGEDPVSIGLWKTSDRDIAWLSKVEKGTVLSVADGYVATNRFLDHGQNADLLMNLIATVAPKGSRIVFADASFSPTQPNLLELLGPGAVAGWYQLLFLFVVVIFTLGKRFGLPELVRATQTGQRELVDAIADTYRRAHATRSACRAAYDRADYEVRRALKLSSDAPAAERDQRLPEPLALEFRRVFEGTIDSLDGKDAFDRCRNLRRQTQDFLKRPA